jgi:ADP-heptose:LPS heptosyltransferase
MPALHIYDPRERAVVAAVDRVLAAESAVRRAFRRRRPPAHPKRILLLRLERIGDLVMALPAIADVRALAPDAEIDLVVGSWNADLAGVISSVTRVETLDAGWLARGDGGDQFLKLVRRAREWRRRRYDLAINFEPDIRSNYLLSQAGAAWTVGYRSGGGGPLLDLALDYDTRSHTTDNATRLVQAAFQGASQPGDRGPLALPQRSMDEADRLLRGAGRPLVGVHPSGGPEIKQWDPARFAAVARRLIEERGATIVLTGSSAERALVRDVQAQLPEGGVIDVAGEGNLLDVAAVLQQLDLFITGDTGPMHLAAAVGTPVVAVFGPSDPARYAPRGPLDRVVRIDLPCAPCNRIRLPPARCTGHIPDCLAGIDARRVFDAAVAVLDAALVAGPRINTDQHGTDQHGSNPCFAPRRA